MASKAESILQDDEKAARQNSRQQAPDEDDSVDPVRKDTNLSLRPTGIREPDPTQEVGTDVSQDVEKAAAAELKDPDPAIDDPLIVWWEGDNDPENPYNWSSGRKYSHCALISALTFVTPLASSIFAPGVPQLMRDFGSSNNELAAFVVSVYVLGFAFGPMLLAPLSEMYGRVPIYHICSFAFVAFTVGCALAPSLDALIALRFLAGSVGAAPLTNGAGSIADMITQDKRAAAMAAFSIGPLIGPIVGPVIGGFVQEAKGWRWVFWVLAMISGFVSVLMVIIMRESYSPVLLERKARRLRKETGNALLRSKLDDGLSNSDRLKRCIVRPLKLLLFSPICTVFALYMVMVYGYLYLLFTSVSFVFQQYYHFSTSSVGLVFIGLGVGSFIGLGWFTYDATKEVKKDMADGGTAKPEVRLRLLPIAAFILPAGFFIYGWTAHFHTHWIGPVLGLTIIGTGNIICFMGISVYLIDAYTLYAASALAANTVMRSIAGAVLPLGALQMYQVLGLGWGNSLLGFIAIALLPIPFLVLKYGEKLRLKFEVKNL